jgi:hypothetical protein
MPARPRELCAALALVLAADVALWSSGTVALRGSGAAIFFVVVPALILVAARARRFTWRLVAMLGMLAAIAARCVYAPTAGSVVGGLAGIFALAITLRSRAAFLTDVAASFGATFATIPMRFVAAATGLRQSFSTRGAREGMSFAPVVIPVALVAVFVAIFGFANPLVGRWLAAAGESIAPPLVLRALSWLVLLPGAVLLLRPAFLRAGGAEGADTNDAAARTSLSVARNALFALNVLFFAYNALDARYLWIGAAPPGVSERAYAHQGAAWLTVGILALTIVVGVMFRGALAWDSRAKALRVLAYLWIGQGVVLALGTYRRLWIHIGTSGLSSLRILGMVGTGLVVVGLLQVGVKLWRQRTFSWLVRRQADAVVLGLLGFSLLPTHLISAPLNVRRVMAHDYQALVHAEEEVGEAESAAALLPMLDHDDERIRRGIAALLLNERDNLRARRANAGLRDYEIAQVRTLAALEEATPKLDAVLGDVDRKDAITPFEYIRNSSIEGEIAESEISKVEFASTRSTKLVKQWVTTAKAGWYQTDELYATTVLLDGVARERTDAIATKNQAVGTWNDDGPFTVAAGSDANHLRVTVPMLHTTQTGTEKVNVLLVLAREPQSPAWHVAEERQLPR